MRAMSGLSDSSPMDTLTRSLLRAITFKEKSSIAVVLVDIPWNDQHKTVYYTRSHSSALMFICFLSLSFLRERFKVLYGRCGEEAAFRGVAYTSRQLCRCGRSEYQIKQFHISARARLRFKENKKEENLLFRCKRKNCKMYIFWSY